MQAIFYKKDTSMVGYGEDTELFSSDVIPGIGAAVVINNNSYKILTEIYDYDQNIVHVIVEFIAQVTETTE